MVKINGNLHITLKDKDGIEHDISNQIVGPFFYEEPRDEMKVFTTAYSGSFSFTIGKSYIKTLRGRRRWWRRWLRGKK